MIRDNAGAVSNKQERQEWCGHKAIVESGCSNVIEMVARRGGGRSPLKFFMEEAMAAGSWILAWKVVHTTRECNCGAHELTQCQRVQRILQCGVARLRCVEQIIAIDCNLTTE